MDWAGAELMAAALTLPVETGAMSDSLVLEAAPGEDNPSPAPAWLLWWAVNRQQKILGKRHAV